MSIPTGINILPADDPRHGTPGGYDAHLRNGGAATSCEPCRKAAAAYEYRRRIDSILGRTRTTNSIGTARRIQALVALGYTFGQIGREFNRSQDWAAKIAHRHSGTIYTSTADKIAELYERWCMTLPDESTGRQRHAAAYARTTARRYGWPPPLAWDDVDDPDEIPCSPAENDEQCYDQAVVERVLGGDWRMPSTDAERTEIARRWYATGRSLADLERLTGFKPERYYRLRDQGDAA